MTELSRRSPTSLTVWWSQNRSWAAPAGCLALLLPALSIAGCAGTLLTFLFGAIKLGTSLRNRE
ncbi:MAG TPA: hypothetical protein DD490_19225 [Acidobacteria bacterium]|nr:hypothetical protein [Acidobacteriota bacterium]